MQVELLKDGNVLEEESYLTSLAYDIESIICLITSVGKQCLDVSAEMVIKWLLSNNLCDEIP